ncbi:MAG: hypothetical protein IT523_01690 [Burkholderiales bacterium]|nr:hypothetical protein [Burkholderiales bacterium]
MTRRDEVHRYWFPAKRYGWGWGLPITWQGWLVLAGYVLLALALVRWVSPREHPWMFVAGMTVLSLAFGVVCWWTGEPPRWRWGDDKR